MVNELLVSLVNSVLGIGKRTSKGNHSYNCPFCNHHKPKLEINFTDNKNGDNPWHCWACNKKGRKLRSLFKQIKASPEYFSQLKKLVKSGYEVEEIKSEEKILELPKEFKNLIGSKNIISRHASAYLKRRNINEDDILKYNIGYCTEGLYSNRIIIPSYNSDGQLNFFVGRDFYDSKMKYRNSPTTKDIVGFDLFINWDEPIILCEGVFDAMSFKRNAIPLFGKTVMNELQKKIIEFKVKVIYLSLDSDAIIDAIKISENFINNGIELRMMEFQENDPNEIGFEKLLYLIKETSVTKFSDLMKMKLNGTRKKHMEI